jgi:hypothetical protein
LLTWAAVQAVILSPLVSWAINHLLMGRGRFTVSNQDIAGFLLSPTGATFAVLTLVSAAALQLGQQSGLQILAHDAQRRTRLTPLATVRRVVLKLPRLAGLAAVLLLRVAAVLLPPLGLLTFFISD